MRSTIGLSPNFWLSLRPNSRRRQPPERSASPSHLAESDKRIAAREAILDVITTLAAEDIPAAAKAAPLKDLAEAWAYLMSPEVPHGAGSVGT